MVQVKLLMGVAAALLLLALPETSAGVLGDRYADDSSSSPDSSVILDVTVGTSHSDVFEVETSSSSESAEALPDSPQQPAEEPIPEGIKVQEVDEPQTEKWTAQVEADKVEENEILPLGPVIDKDEVDTEPLLVAEQPWESKYKHGVSPARLPAKETDNAHSFRHSIIYPYGDDLHA